LSDFRVPEAGPSPPTSPPIRATSSYSPMAPGSSIVPTSPQTRSSSSSPSTFASWATASKRAAPTPGPIRP